MNLAIMQPYFLPYIGYFQLIASADTFVLYDNIKYTKKGWINRNRRLQNGADATFSLPLRKASDSLDVVDRELAADFDPDALLNQLKGSYARAPYFSRVCPVIDRIVRCEERNLFRYIHHSVDQLCALLGITTRIRTSSGIDIDHRLTAQDKVIALCHALGADTTSIRLEASSSMTGPLSGNRESSSVSSSRVLSNMRSLGAFRAVAVDYRCDDVHSPDDVRALVSSHYELI